MLQTTVIPELVPEHFDLIVKFVQLAKSMREELRMYCIDDSSAEDLLELPEHVERFLMQAMDFNDSECKQWWLRLNDLVWTSADRPLMREEIELLLHHGPSVAGADDQSAMNKQLGACLS